MVPCTCELFHSPPPFSRAPCNRRNRDAIDGIGLTTSPVRCPYRKAERRCRQVWLACNMLIREPMLTARKQNEGLAGASSLRASGRVVPFRGAAAPSAVVIPPAEGSFTANAGRRSIRRRLAAILGADIRNYS